jgi:hypothetical protein
VTRSEEIHGELWSIVEDNVGLDRPQQGLLTVSQTALTDLLRQMTPTAP